MSYDKFRIESNRVCPKKGCSAALFTDGNIAISNPPSMLYWCPKCNTYRYYS